MTQSIDVFISYKREERALAEQVAAALEAAGYTQVTDLNLKNSEHFGDAIDRMIRTARVVLVLWTPASAESEWVKNEARLGAELGTYLGAMVEATDLPVDLKFKQYIDLEGATLAASMPRIVSAISDIVGPPKITPQIAANQSDGLNDDLRLFETVDRLQTVAAFTAYLDAFPGGVMAPVARDRINALKTVGYRLRRLLPGAAVLAILVPSSLALTQIFFSDEADVYFERRERLEAAEAELVRLQGLIEQAPDPVAIATLRQQLEVTQAALAAASNQEQGLIVVDRTDSVEVATRAIEIEADIYCIGSEDSPGVRFSTLGCVPASVRVLELIDTQVSDSQVEAIATFPNLRELSLTGSTVPSLAPLLALENLHRLKLPNGQTAGGFQNSASNRAAVSKQIREYKSTGN